MALFTKGNADNSTDVYEAQLREVKAERIRLIRQIGEKYLELYRNTDLTGSPFAEMVKGIEENEKKETLLFKQQLAARGLRKCDSCGAELPIDSIFCNKCGTKQSELEKAVVIAGKKCPRCGKDVEENDSFCMECGYKF